MEYQKLFELAKREGLTNLQIAETTITKSSAKIINRQLESYLDSDDITYTLKAEYNGKTVKTTTNYLDEALITEIKEKVTYTDTTYSDSYLNDIENISKEEIPQININKEIETIKKLPTLFKNDENKIKVKTSITENYTNTRIVNTNNIDISTSSHTTRVVLEAIKENNGKYTSYESIFLVTDKAKLDYEKIIKNMLAKLSIMENKDKLKSGKNTIILSSAVAASIISNLIPMLSCGNVRKKISCLANKLNTKIFSEKLTIEEAPTDSKYPGYCLFDNEGTKTFNKQIVEKGTLKTYLADIKEAKIYKISPTGNSYNGISTRNMYIRPGKKSEEEIIKETIEGVYISDYMGSSISAINPTTGNISIQIFGFKIKNGELVSGIEPCILTTTIFELLSNIVEIANNLEFSEKEVGAPSIKVNNMSIAS